MTEENRQYSGLPDEQSLVERAKTDDAAFSVLYEFYFPKIYGYVFKRIGNRENTEDIVSTAFMKIFCNLKQYKNDGFSFAAWVYRVATNCLIDHCRKFKIGKEILMEETPETAESAAAVDLDDDFIAKEKNREMVGFILRKLPKRYQRVLHCRFFADMDAPLVAATLKITENNARVLLHRALQKFQKIFQKYAK